MRNVGAFYKRKIRLIDTGELTRAGHASRQQGKKYKTEGDAIQLDCRIGEQVKHVTLTDIVHAPDAINNLISLSQLTDAGCKLVFEGDKVAVLSPKLRSQVMTGTKTGRLYHMDLMASSHMGTEIAMAAKERKT